MPSLVDASDEANSIRTELQHDTIPESLDDRNVGGGESIDDR